MKIIKKTKLIIAAVILLITFIISYLLSQKLIQQLLSTYHTKQSTIITDRQKNILAIKPNHQGYHAEYSNTAPVEFVKLLLQKEDRYFYYHLGINPFSIFRAGKNYLLGKQNVASSTITQQLVKILLANENQRNFKNKLTETFYALALELNLSKHEIMTMYLNSIFLGNNMQGITSASRLYFDTSQEMLTTEQQLQLLATISSPASNPFTINNAELINNLSEQLNLKINKLENLSGSKIKNLKNKFKNYNQTDSWFEFNSLSTNCSSNCELTIDKNLTNNLREILHRNLQPLIQKNATNGAVVVIKVPENQLLAIIGSPDPHLNESGYQINMATSPRPIGSTVKPFIYLKGWEKNLRPYTLVEDKEYKYTIGNGFAFYPKNYDYQYRGEVSLHYALSNSLNVPTVKVLEYVGLDNFYNFLLNDLKFQPVQDLNNYQLGIALGELEMDLLSLSYYFTIFPNHGQLKPLTIYQNNQVGIKKYSANSDLSQNKNIADEKYIQLINKILNDRQAGVEQFGSKSDLNLLANNYAVKTGTSREFHDSWTIGYTPDFLVGVWVGNVQNEPMETVSGQTGAGRVWHEAMNLLLNSEYHQNSKFDFNLIKEFNDQENIEYGLNQDNFEEQKNLLKNNNLIINPHDQDTFLLEPKTQIPLKAREIVDWFIDDKFFVRGLGVVFSPTSAGEFLIRAVGENDEEEVGIFVENEE